MEAGGWRSPWVVCNSANNQNGLVAALLDLDVRKSGRLDVALSPELASEHGIRRACVCVSVGVS